MKIIASVQAKRGSSRGLVHYIAHSKLDVEREPEKGRELFNAFANDLSVESANNSLKAGIAKARPSNDELHHLVLSFRPEDFQSLGKDEKTRRRAAKDITQAAMKRLESAVSADRLDWAAAVHLNTENPHVHIAIQKQYFTRQIERRVLTKIPREVLPHFEYRNGDKVLVPGILIEAATLKMEQLIAQNRERHPNRDKNASIERGKIGDLGQDLTHERELLRQGFLSEFELQRIDSKINNLVENGDKLRFLVSDPASGTRRRLSLQDIKEQGIESETSPKSPAEIRIRTILLKMLAKEESAKAKLHSDTSDVSREADRLKERYRKNDWKLPAPSFTKDEIDQLQEHYLAVSDLRKFSYLECVRFELERSGEIAQRSETDFGRLAATKMISELRAKVHEKTRSDLSERRYYTKVEIGGKRVSLAALDREENASTSSVAKLVASLKETVSGLVTGRGRESEAETKNDPIRDEIHKKLNERLAGHERDKKTEQKSVRLSGKVLTGTSSAEPVFSAEQLAEIESLSSRLKLSAIYEDSRREQQKLIEAAGSDSPVASKLMKTDPSTDFEEHKHAVIGGRAVAGEIVARMELEKAKENLKTFTSSKRFEKFAVPDKKTGKVEFLSLHDVDISNKGSILDRAVREITETREHRAIRRTVTALANSREQRLKDEINGAKEILACASREASGFVQFSFFGLKSEPLYLPVFTTSEIASIEMRIAVTNNEKEAAQLQKVLESSTGEAPRSLKEILRDFEAPPTTRDAGQEKSSPVHELAERTEPVVSEPRERQTGRNERSKEPEIHGYSR